MVSDERTGTGSSRYLLEYWRLNFGKSCIVKHATHCAQYGGTFLESVFHAFVDHQIYISLAVAQFGVFELVVGHSVLVFHDWQRLQAL